MKVSTKILSVLISGLCYGYFLFYSTIPGRIFMNNKDIITEGPVYDEIWRVYGTLPQSVKDMLLDSNYRIYVVNSIQNEEK